MAIEEEVDMIWQVDTLLDVGAKSGHLHHFRHFKHAQAFAHQFTK